MRIYRGLFKKLENDTVSKWSNYYSELHDFPLFNWMQCNEGNYIFCRRNPNEGDEETDQEVWRMLYDQYIKKYGLGKLYKRLLSVMKEKAVYELEFVDSRDRFKLTEIELKEIELKSMIDNNGKGMTIDESLIYLSKWLGYRLNPKEINVVEYFTILDQYGKANS